MPNTASRHNGLLALSPLLVFLCVYLGVSIIANDFYAVPMSFSFLIASLYALCITKGSLKTRIAAFRKGAGEKNILLMIAIFILAGIFAATAKTMGAIDAIVNISISMLPGKLLYAGLFLASCFISMSIGTSVGTIVALVPIAAGIASQMTATGDGSILYSTPFVTAIIVGGAFFGDNLSFISDTTIAATRTQGCTMSDKFKVNFRIVAPAAIIVTLLYIFLGADVNAATVPQAANWALLLPYLLVIALALVGVNVLAVLAIGIIANATLGIGIGAINIQAFGMAAAQGMFGMADLIAVTLLAGGMLELIRIGGGLDYIINLITRRINSKRGAQLSIAALVSFANICTANNTIAIISVGAISRNIATQFGIDPRKSASLLDTFSCLIQGFLPYGAQLLLASQLAGTTPLSITRYLFYPVLLGICALLAILLRLPRKYS